MGPLSSTEVLGDYLVRRVVTSDQNRSVVAAEHRPSRRAVALTVWPARLLDADRTRALLGRLDVLRGIHHDNLAAIVDAGTLPDGGVFAAAEWIDGPTLESVIARGPLPLTRAHAVLKGVATGIAAAHDRGVLHGDLRPAHVLLATSGAGLETPKVTNLGTGNAWAAIGAGTGALPDSPAYLSPEQ